MSRAFIAELRRAKRASGAPWVRKFGNLSMREILVMTSAYAHPRVQTLGEGEWSPKAARPGVGEENRLWEIGSRWHILSLLTYVNRAYNFDIHVMINWQLSKQGIRWPVSNSITLLYLDISFQLKRSNCMKTRQSRLHVVHCWIERREESVLEDIDLREYSRFIYLSTAWKVMPSDLG